MRRLAAVFSSSSKRDKADSSEPSSIQAARRSQTNLSLSRRKNIKASLNTANLQSSFDSTLSTPQLSASSDHGQSSASSTGSASLQTPEESPVTFAPPQGRGKSWFPWMGRKSGTIKGIHRDEDWSQNTARPRHQPSAAHNRPLNDDYEDSDTSESEEEDDEEVEQYSSVAHEPTNHATRARGVIQNLIHNSLQHKSSSRPFVERHGLPLYPRSCNISRTLPKADTLEVTMHKRLLLRRLSDGPGLTPQEERSILPFSSRRTPTLAHSIEPPLDEAFPSKIDKVHSYSPGLRRWVTRQPFEDSHQIWLCVDGALVYQRVASAFAVAALEFSEAIEAMAHSFSTPYSPTEPYSSRAAILSPEPSSPSTTPSSSSSSTSLVPPTSGSQPRASPSLLAPSPLRHQTNSSEHLPPLSLSDGPEPSHAPTSPTSPTSLTSSSSATTGKRGVRFAEDDKEDTIPIGYVLRIKKQKEQKARFLREERERRQFEEERRREEAERKRRDEERRQWELEKKAWQREKKAMEDERKSRLYAEEFAASRQRAESQRRGMKISTSSTSLRESPERNTTQDSKTHLRLPFDASRRQDSDGTSSPHTPSPASSRPPSILGYPGQNTLHPPRPASFHSSRTASSEDVRLSTISTASAPGRSRGTTVPAWSTSQSSLLIPPVPPLLPNMFPVDMPLLPPTAPFMMNAFPRARSYNSSPSSRHSSSERVNIQGSEHSRSGSSPHRSNISHSLSSSPHRPTHNRRTSDDSNHRRRSQAPSSQGPSSYFQQSLPRGRSMYPVYNLPSPWTALPTQTGVIPTAMPYSTNTPGRVAPARRQTTFS